MDINIFKDALAIFKEINTAERKLDSIETMFSKNKPLYIGDGSGGKFEISVELELKIRELIKEEYASELDVLNGKFQSI